MQLNFSLVNWNNYTKTSQVYNNRLYYYMIVGKWSEDSADCTRLQVCNLTYLHAHKCTSMSMHGMHSVNVFRHSFPSAYDGTEFALCVCSLWEHTVFYNSTACMYVSVCLCVYIQHNYACWIGLLEWTTARLGIGWQLSLGPTCWVARPLPY